MYYLKKHILIFFLSVWYLVPCVAQPTVKLQAAIGYIEHFSIGPTLSLADKHSISLLYGSNLIQPKAFSTYLLEYSFKFGDTAIGKMTPALGVKGGHVIFSDDYYRWQVASVIPFFRTYYSLSDRLNLFVDLGASISFEQKVERIRFGEIGKYRDILPELKIGTHFSLNKK
jgi:hypothetical protein